MDVTLKVLTASIHISFLFCAILRVPTSSEVQGLLVRTMQYFQAKVNFKRRQTPGHLFLLNQFQKCSISVPLIGQNTAHFEIIITISIAVHIKNNKNFGSYIHAIFHINYYYNFNLCSIFENMTSFSPILNQDLEHGKLIGAVDSWKQRSKDREF